jgi:hypothetical protein
MVFPCPLGFARSSVLLLLSVSAQPKQPTLRLTRFECIRAWQEARKLVKLVYEAVGAGSSFSQDFRLVNQIQGAAVSAMSNMAEGLSPKGEREFVQFLFV